MNKMLHQKNENPVVKFVKGFEFATNGVCLGAKERNMRFHVFVAVLVIVFGFLLNITLIEWLFVFFAISMVWSAELFNSSIEHLSNIIRDELGAPYDPIGPVKDMSAGAVLVASFFAAAVGLIVFLPYLIELAYVYFM